MAARSNHEIAQMLHELAVLTELEEGSPQAFRVRAYQNAVRAVDAAQVPVAELGQSELTELKGIGKSTAARIREFIDTGTVAKLEELRSAYPPGFVELTRIPGLGPKTLIQLRERLGIENLEQLKAAIAGERLRDLPGLGARTEEKLARAIERLGLAGKERRTPILDALPIAEQIVAELAAVAGVKAAAYAGSLRRFRETIGDVDVLVAAGSASRPAERFTTLPMVAEVIARGDTKSSILTQRGLQVDLRVVKPKQFGSALMYFTGSKAHNIALRQRAIERGWLLNEYGLFDAENERLLVAATEDGIYRKLGLEFIPPELREDNGEIELAAEHSLPTLVELEDLQGDLHVHTDLSGDGRDSLEDMLAAAVRRGFRYIAITDHGEDLSINGVDRAGMLAQRRRIEQLRPTMPGLRILHGSELNIAADGSLDYDDEFLAGFDWCVASVHSQFDLPAARQTERVIRAMMHPAVNAIGHLTGRRVGKRPGIELDVDAVLEAAEATGTALEINSNLDRLDAPPEVLLAARGRGVVFTISTDAHWVAEYEQQQWGVRAARRGWVERDSVVNTWETDRFLEWVAAKRRF